MHMVLSISYYNNESLLICNNMTATLQRVTLVDTWSLYDSVCVYTDNKHAFDSVKFLIIYNVSMLSVILHYALLFD